jgi:hypothetical protein
MKIRPMEAELFHMDTKRETDMTELTVAYRNFATSDCCVKDKGAITTHIPAESTRLLRCSLFWALAQRIVAIPYRCLGIAYRSHLVLTFENGTRSLYRQVGKELTLYAK